MFFGDSVPYKMHEKQFEAIEALSNNDRFHHFISKVADWEQLWTVRNDEGFLVPVAPEGFEYFPIWPHPEYAQTITDINFPGHKVEEISIYDFLENWVPKLLDDKIKVAVFPNKEWTFWCIDADDLLAELMEEMQQYE